MARQVKKDLPEVYKALRGISKSLVSLEKKTAEDRTEAGGISYHASRDFPDSLTDPVAAFINETEGWMLTRGDDEEDYTDALISLFFDLLHFKNISELYSSEYRTMITGKGSRLELTLLCLDPGIMLGKVMDTARSSILSHSIALVIFS